MTNSLQPKESFISDAKRSDVWVETCMNPHFKYALQVAWSEFSLRKVSHDPTAGLKLAGAREFIETLLNLGEKKTLTEAKPHDQLQPT